MRSCQCVTHANTVLCSAGVIVDMVSNVALTASPSSIVDGEDGESFADDGGDDDRSRKSTFTSSLLEEEDDAIDSVDARDGEVCRVVVASLSSSCCACLPFA